MKRLVIINLILLISIYIIPKQAPPENHINTTTNKVAITSRSSEPRQEEIPLENPTIKNKPTNISQEGINLIKKYEGLKLNSYRLQGEEYYTIGYGHYGSDVKAGQTITEEQAERLLIADLQGTVNFILENYSYLELNQNELDALVSFTYNCGIGSLNKLTGNKTRSKQEIAEHITSYTRSGSEANRKGLAKRRLEEKKIFLGGNYNEEN